MTNDMQQKRWEQNYHLTNNETVRIWIDDFLEIKNKMSLDECTVEEIIAEIEENKGSIDNFRMWGDRHAVIDCEEYIELLQEALEVK